MAKRQFTPKGAIQVLSSDDPKAFYETYVKTGQTLVVTLPMTVKNELTKTGVSMKIQPIRLILAWPMSRKQWSIMFLN